MGIIISKFRRKPTTIEILETLENDIKEIEDNKSNTEIQRKKIIAQLIIYSFGLYFISALLFYFFFFPANFYDQFFYIAPLICFPLIIFIVHQLLTWYFNRKIRQNQSKLIQMKIEKKKILDNVMETEKYKVAKEILEKFAPDQLRKSSTISDAIITKSSPLSLSSTSTPIKNTSFVRPNTPVNSNYFLTSNQLAPRASFTPEMRTNAPSLPNITNSFIANSEHKTPNFIGQRGLKFSDKLNATKPIIQTPNMIGNSPYLPLPRPILKHDRTVFDKLVDSLIGDGPNNRYALICNKCSSHNGMALREEFEYVSFRCCYCYAYNPARKLKPSAPRLNFEANVTPKTISNGGVEEKNFSESEKNSPPDSSDSDLENLEADEANKNKIDDVKNLDDDNNHEKSSFEKKED